MVLTTAAAAKQNIIYGVKRARVPAALRATAPNQKKEPEETSCLKEMDVLFTCWARTKYQDNQCSEELSAFLTCSDKAVSAFHKTGGKIGTKYDQKLLNDILRKHTVTKKRGQTEKKKFLTMDHLKLK